MDYFSTTCSLLENLNSAYIIGPFWLYKVEDDHISYVWALLMHIWVEPFYSRYIHFTWRTFFETGCYIAHMRMCTTTGTLSHCERSTLKLVLVVCSFYNLLEVHIEKYWSKTLSPFLGDADVLIENINRWKLCDPSLEGMQDQLWYQIDKQ